MHFVTRDLHMYKVSSLSILLCGSAISGARHSWFRHILSCPSFKELTAAFLMLASLLYPHNNLLR